MSPYSVIIVTSLGLVATALCGAAVCWTCVWRRRRRQGQTAGYEALDGQQGGWKLDDMASSSSPLSSSRLDIQDRLSGETTLASPAGRGDGHAFGRGDGYDT
jgi:hypothetical protein